MSNNTTQTEELFDELDYRIGEPNVCRLEILVGRRGPDGGGGDRPRLWLMDGCDDYGPDMDILSITVGREAWLNVPWDVARPRRKRAGTMPRFREDVAMVKRYLSALGWTLTADEQALMDALDEYGRKAPARLRVAA